MSVAIDQRTSEPHSAAVAPLGQLGLSVALGASLVTVLDFSVVNVALPALGVAMGISTATSG